MQLVLQRLTKEGPGQAASRYGPETVDNQTLFVVDERGTTGGTPEYLPLAIRKVTGRAGDLCCCLSELMGIGEALVDAGETHVRNTVVHPQDPEHRSPDRLRADFRARFKPDLLLDLTDDRINLEFMERTVLRGRPQAPQQFRPVERLASPVAFHHDQRHIFDPLERGVPP